MKKIGVFGSAIGDHTEEEKEMAFVLGREIAKHGFGLVTGATFGLPNSAIEGAHSMDGFSIGISPAAGEKEHKERYGMPLDDDVIVYTGLGFDGRNLINIRTSDAALFIKGSIGTLNELTVAIKEEKVIGILEGSGGISSKVREIISAVQMNFSPKIFYSDDPAKLVEMVVDEIVDETGVSQGGSQDGK
jgi:hypothetical protein